MKAGAAQICITPPVGVDLTGFIARRQPSVGVHDDLFVRVLYLQAGNERLVWVHADIVGWMRSRVQRLRKTLCRRLRLKERQVVFSATHTHSGPATLPLRNCGKMDLRYLRRLERDVVRAAVDASRAVEPVTVAMAEGRVNLSVDRRGPSRHAHVDPRLPTVGLRRRDGSFLAVIGNYAMHNVGLGSSSRVISADMAGCAAEYARARLAGSPVVLMTAGGCGNLNPRVMSGDAVVMEKMGRKLGRGIVVASRAARADRSTALASRLSTVHLRLIGMSRQEVLANHRRSVAAMPGSEPWRRRWRAAMTMWRDETLALLKRGGRRSIPVEVQVVRIGPVSFVGIGAEVFSRMADELRAACGSRVYVVGYANGDCGYLPFREIYPEGGYEISDAYKFYDGNFMVAPGSYERVRDQAVRILKTRRGD